MVIAHRLSTLLEMDRLVVLDQGEDCGSRNPPELLHRKGTMPACGSGKRGFLPDRRSDG